MRKFLLSFSLSNPRCAVEREHKNEQEIHYSTYSKKKSGSKRQYIWLDIKILNSFAWRHKYTQAYIQFILSKCMNHGSGMPEDINTADAL